MAKLKSFFGAKLVSEDEFGNKYYEKGSRRMVIYNGIPESSKVPPLYHAWLHGNGEIPVDRKTVKPSWLKGHLPNLSGASIAYYPEGHPVQASHTLRKVRGSYNSWEPTGDNG